MVRARRTPVGVIALLLSTVAAAASAHDGDRLQFLAVTGDGGVIAERRADVQVNPASVIKVGTTLWALDRLGAEHRYSTVFAVAGEWDRSTGVVRGDLVVRGGGDPDFQWENAYLIARELNRLGLHRVEGRLRIDGVFWFGWEHGVETRLVDPARRSLEMGRRLV